MAVTAVKSLLLLLYLHYVLHLEGAHSALGQVGKVRSESLYSSGVSVFCSILSDLCPVLICVCSAALSLP